MSTLDMGNDREAARRELIGQYGVHQNAEQLIQAHRASQDPLVVATGMKPVDTEATAEMDTAAIEVPEGHEVIDACVRGNAYYFVAADENGTYYKGAQLLEEGVGAPKQSAADAAAYAWDKAQTDIRETAATEIAGVEAEVQAFRAEKMAELGEKLREKSEEAAEEAASEAEAAAEAEAGAAEAPAEEAPKATATRARAKPSE